MTPRLYQSDCLDKTRIAFEQYDRVLNVLPTGAGKTVIFSIETARRNSNGERVLILADRDELVNQAIDKLQRATGLIADKEKAEDYASLDSPVVVGSIQTLVRRFNRWPQDHFGLIICDECDLSLAASWQTVLKYFNTQVLGVTATPDRGDKKNLGQYYQTIGFEISLFDLINQGYLSPITVKSVPLKIDLSKVGSMGGDFKEGELGDAIEPYLDQIAASIKEHAGNRRTLAFLPLITTSQKFVMACNEIGLKSAHVDGKSPNRAEILRAFEQDKFQVLSNSMLLNRGYDVDSEPTGIGIDCVAVLRPTRSRPLYCQMVGRGTRTALFKDNLLLLDFLWHHEAHSICRPASLISNDEVECEQITEEIGKSSNAMPGDVADELSEVDLQVMCEKAQEERLRRELEAQKHRKETTISPEQMAAFYHDSAISHFEPVMESDYRPITESQMEWLKKAKIDGSGKVFLHGNAPKDSKPLDISQIKGEAHASKILGHLFNSKNKGIAMATEGQKRTMRRLGYVGADTATAHEARQFFAGLKRRREEALI